MGLKFSKAKQIQKNEIDVQEFKAVTYKEENLQGECEQILDDMKIEYYRVPDVLYKNRAPHIRKIASKYLKGKPDLLIMRPHDDIYIKALAIELKTKKGRLTQSQKKFQRKLPLVIIRSVEQFRKCVDAFLYDEE